MQINLKEMYPTRAFIFGSCPCEGTAAAVNNKAVKSMEQLDIPAVALRFLQSRQGENCTFSQVLFYGIAASYFCFSAPLSLQSRLGCLNVCLYNLWPNLFNTFTYKKTKVACKEWLIEHTNKETFGKIDNLIYSNGGINELSALLHKKNIEVESLKGRNVRYNRYLSARIFNLIYRIKKGVVEMSFH